MKKLLVILIWCLLISGCGRRHQPASVQEEPIQNQTVIYIKDDITLSLIYSDDFPEGFEFQFDINGYGLGEFARFEDNTHQKAIGQENEDGHTYSFTLKKDSVIVKESEGQNALGIDLSGKYIKE
ncbi:hypothetical protein [Candidatus Stoquefichus massiliensis]|uniref:hypothetical protein n=1 Tax=Candidatus Stoquefichus massiliensis TaxID=1470350 RepID=UPI0004871A41|nr:hypothetical protein [Candidatus Stoquefichus massiliensis]